jgi:uncharacterized membrane protein
VVHKHLSYVFGAALLILVTERYSALSSNVADLGFFLSNFAGIDSQWQRAFYGHVQPLMLLWGAGYQALPASVAPLALVTLQTLALLGSVMAIWRVFGPWPGVAMLLYYPLWANALFDFHFDHMAVPLLTAFFINCEQRRFGWATLAAAALVLIKEPLSLQTVGCGLYFGWLAFHQRGSGVSLRLVVFGTLLALWGAGWFYGSTHWLLPYFGDGGPGALQSEAFSWLKSSLTEMVWTLVSRPDRVLVEIFSTPGKLVYLAVVFGLLAFVPLLRPAALIVALPLLIIAMLSRLENYYGYANHYTAGVIVPAVVAFRDGLPIARGYFASMVGWIMSKIERYYLKLPTFSTWKKYSVWIVSNERQIFSVALLAWLLVGHWAFASSPISRLFWSDKVWSYSWHAYVPTEREDMMKQAMLQYIPADPDVSVTTQNTVNWGHLAHRKVYLPFPLGVDVPHRVMDWSNRDLPGLWLYVRTGDMPPAITHDRNADYVVLDLKRPWFIIDKGCGWLYGACRNDEMAAKFLRLVYETRQRYSTVFERDGFMILRRK